MQILLLSEVVDLLKQRINKIFLLAVALLTLFALLFGGSSFDSLKSYIHVIHEGVGIPSTVDNPQNAKNYVSTIDKNKWVVSYDYLNGKDYTTFTIRPTNKLKIVNTIGSGKLYLKITQGDLLKSKIFSLQLLKDVEYTLKLNQWQDGEIILWILGDKAEKGSLTIEKNS